MIESTLIEHLEKSNVRIKITVSSNETEKAYKKVLKDAVQTASIPGFRKGKVPESILERKFGEAIRSDASKTIIEECLKEFFETAEPKPLSFDPPLIESIHEFKQGESFLFEVVYDIFPKAELSNISNLSIEEPQVTVDSDAITHELTQLQEQNAIVIEKPNGKVELNDIIQYKLYMLNENGEEIPDSTIEDSIQVTEESLSQKNLSTSVIGLAVNTETIIEVPEIDTSANEESEQSNQSEQNTDNANQTKTQNEPILRKAKITITSIRERQLPPIDDELAQDINEDFTTLSDLKKHISTELKNQLSKQLDDLRKNSILRQISQENPIILPESMIRAEFENRWNNVIGGPVGDTKDAQKFQGEYNGLKRTLFESWRPDIEIDLRHQLIIQTLIDERKITASREAIDKKIEEESTRTGKNFDQTKEYLENMGYIEYIEHDIKNSVLMEQLLQNTEIKKGKKIKYLDFLNELKETPL